jgi:DNA-binding winged helix-turn-helix (wHTH) protein
MLRLLIEHHGQLVSKQMLLDHVWTGTCVGDDAVTQRMSILRKAVGEDANHVRFIETVPKRGYRSVAPIRALKR